MLSSNGNPRADNLFAVISELQKREGVELGINAVALPSPASGARATQ
jgi:hypothetical protein